MKRTSWDQKMCGLSSHRVLSLRFSKKKCTVEIGKRTGKVQNALPEASPCVESLILKEKEKNCTALNWKRMGTHGQHLKMDSLCFFTVQSRRRSKDFEKKHMANTWKCIGSLKSCISLATRPFFSTHTLLFLVEVMRFFVNSNFDSLVSHNSRPYTHLYQTPFDHAFPSLSLSHFGRNPFKT